MLSGVTALKNDGTSITGSIATKTSSDLTASGATVTAPAGYYASSASKSVTTMTLPTTAASSATSGYTSKLTISRSTSNQYINIPPGYNSAGGYYTISGIADGTITPTISNSGLSTYFNSGTSSDKNLTLTPQYTNTAGYVAAHTTAQSGTATYYKIKTASPAFDGGGLSGGSTAAGTNVTLSTTDNGMKIQTSYTATRAAVLYNGAVEGWVSKADNAEALASGSLGSTNGTAYYVTAVTMPKDKGFTVTTTADTALDTTSDLDVTNNAYRRVDITNKANGTVIVTNSGNVTVSSGSTTAGNLTVTAYNSSNSSEANKSIVSAGKWVATSVSAAGTYYGRVTVGSGSATAPASISGSSATVSTGTNTLTFTKTISVTPSVTAGYVASGTAGNASVSLTASVTTKAAATITPGTSDQTIAAGTYLTGAQTIAGSANLIAANIKEGVVIFGITGTHSGGTDGDNLSYGTTGNANTNAATVGNATI